MKLGKLRKKARKVLTYMALIAFVLNASFVVDMAPEAKAALPTSDTIVAWDFEDDDNVADSGITANLEKTISGVGTSAYSFFTGNPGRAISASSWNIDDYWKIEFDNSGYKDLKLSSTQRSSSTGPRDFQIEYSLDGTSWIAVSGGAFAVTSDSTWNTAISNLVLPSAVNNQSSIYLRWVVTSDVSVSGGALASTGTNRIDNIVVTGTPNTAPTKPILIAPLDNSYLNSGNMTLSWDPSSDVDNDSLTYELRLNDLFDYPRVDSSATFENLSGLSERVHTWAVRAYDGYAYSEWSDTHTFTVDTTAPIVTIHAPADPSYVSGEVSIVASIEDDNLSHYFLKIVDSSNNVIYQSPNEGGTGGVISNEFTNQEILSWDTTFESDGEYTISLEARDLASNKDGDLNTPGDSYKEVEVEVDNTAPDAPFDSFLDATNPTNNNNPTVYGEFDNSQIISLSSALHEIQEIEVIFDNGSEKYVKNAKLNYETGGYSTYSSDDFTVVSASSTKEFLPDGVYKITAIAYDKAGNKSPAEVIENALKIDTQEPEAPLNLTVTQKTPTSVSLKWSAAVDNVGGSGVSGYRVYSRTPNGSVNYRDVGNVTEYTYTGLNPQTKYTFWVTTLDKAGNESKNYSSEVSETTPQALVASVSTEVDYGSYQHYQQEEREGIVESAQAQEVEDENGDEKDESKEAEDEDEKKGSSLIWWLIILGVLGGLGYYYNAKNPGSFKKIFKKGNGGGGTGSAGGSNPFSGPPQSDL